MTYAIEGPAIGTLGQSAMIDIRLHSDATRFAPDGRNVILMHLLSDALTWGLGFSQALDERWPNTFHLLRGQLQAEQRSGPGIGQPRVTLGEVLWTAVEEPIVIAHLIAENSRANPDSPLDHEALRGCLRRVAERAIETKAVVHAPPLGSGLSGAGFSCVRRFLDSELTELGVPVVIHCLGGHIPD